MTTTTAPASQTERTNLRWAVRTASLQAALLLVGALGCGAPAEQDPLTSVREQAIANPHNLIRFNARSSTPFMPVAYGPLSHGNLEGSIVAQNADNGKQYVYHFVRGRTNDDPNTHDVFGHRIDATGRSIDDVLDIDEWEPLGLVVSSEQLGLPERCGLGGLRAMVDKKNNVRLYFRKACEGWLHYMVKSGDHGGTWSVPVEMKQQHESTSFDTLSPVYDSTRGKYYAIRSYCSGSPREYWNAIVASNDGINWWSDGEILLNTKGAPDGSVYRNGMPHPSLRIIGDYFLLAVTGGMDEVEGKWGTSHDWPTAVGLWRCPVSEDPQKKDCWKEYAYNPVMLRGSARTKNGAAIWHFNVAKLDRLGPGANETAFLAAYEAHGIKDDTISTDDSNLLRDHDYPFAWESKSFSTTWLSVMKANSLWRRWVDRGEVDSAEPQYRIPTGEYTLKNKYSGKYLRAGDEVNRHEHPTTGGRTQRWILRRSNGLFTLQPKHGASEWRLTSYQRWDDGELRYGRHWQMNKMQDEWLIETTKYGYVRLQNRFTGNYLTVDGDTPRAHRFDPSSDCQKWILEFKKET